MLFRLSLAALTRILDRWLVIRRPAAMETAIADPVTQQARVTPPEYVAQAIRPHGLLCGDRRPR